MRNAQEGPLARLSATRMFRGARGRIALTTAITYGGVGLSLISAPLVARELSASGRGILAASFVLVQLFTWIGFLGVPRTVAISGSRGIRLSRWTIFVLVALGLVNLVICWIAPALISPDPTTRFFAQIASIALLGSGLSQLGLEHALASGRIIAWNVARSGPAYIPSLIYIGAFLMNSLTLEVGFIGALVGQLFSVAAGIVLVRPMLTGSGMGRIEWRPSLVYWASTVSDGIAARADQLMLAIWASPSALGVYVIALTAASASGAAAQAVNHVTYARFVDNFADGTGVTSLSKPALLSGLGSLASGVLVVAAVASLGPILLGPSFAGLTFVTSLLVLAQAIADQYQLRVLRDSAAGDTAASAIASTIALVAFVGVSSRIGTSDGLSAGAMGALLTSFYVAKIAIRAGLFACRNRCRGLRARDCSIHGLDERPGD